MAKGDDVKMARYSWEEDKGEALWAGKSFVNKPEKGTKQFLVQEPDLRGVFLPFVT